ncbi:MAG: DegV family protein [Oscillospiraceae bacterium]|nr:DegV family protein [Oscillospiraceae bacterium]
MEKIKLITDSTSDIPLPVAEELGIDVLSIMLSVNGGSYAEQRDLSTDEFYDLLVQSDELPTTSQITSFTYEEKFKEYLDAGYTDVICVTINSKGSATHQNAQMAKAALYDNYPMAQEQMRIHIIDSKCYTAVYGYPVQQAAKMAARGIGAAEIVGYLEDWFDKVTVYVIPHTLKYAKKSGRISAAAAFAGDLLGLKPVIQFVDGENKVIEKVRGEKKIVPTLAEKAEKMIKSAPYLILRGSNSELPEELAQELTQRLGYPPEDIVKIGAAVSINIGPEITAVLMLEDK